MATYYLPSETGWSGSSSESIEIYLRFKIDQTYDASTNKSSLSVRLQARLTSSGYNFSDYQVEAGTVQIANGSAQSAVGCYVNLSEYNMWRDITSGGSAKIWTYTVTHNADGTASVPFKMTAINLYKYYNGADHNCRFPGDHTATLSLSEARQSTIASCSSSAETKGNISLTMNRTGSLYHKAKVKDGSSVLTTTEAFATSTTISVPRSWFMSHGSATSFSVTVSVQSYTDSSCTVACGDPVTTAVTIKADSGMKPALKSGYATAAPYNTGSAAAGINKFVSGYSKAEVTLNSSKLDMSAAVGASVSSIKVEGGGTTATSSPYRTGVLRDTETITITVTDSRGRSGIQTLTVATLPYSPPRLSNITVIRCDSSGLESEGGTYYAVTVTLTISSLDGANSATLTANGYALTSGARRILGGTLNADKSYTVTILGEDSLGNIATMVITLPGRKWAMRFRENGEGVGFGMTPEIGDAIEIPESWSLYIGKHRIWGKMVRLEPGASTSVQLEPWTQYLVAPDYGPVWVVQTRRAEQQPLVGTAFSAVSNSLVSCVAGDNCAITLKNTDSSDYYRFNIRKL